MIVKLNFIETELVKLMEKQPILRGHKIAKCSAAAKTHLDGFMSSIFTVELQVKNDGGGK